MRRAVLLLALAACAAPPRAEPGLAGPAPALRLAPSDDFRLGNGLRVFLVPDRAVPLVGFAARVEGGSSIDAPGKEGTAELLAALLRKGAGDRDAAEFQEAVDFAGGTFGTGTGLRWLSLSGEFLSRDADLALELLADALQRPLLDEAELLKERGLSIDAIRAAREDPAGILPDYYYAWLFTGDPVHARPPGGREGTLAAITPDDVRAAADVLLKPERTWLAVAGDFDPAAMRRDIEARFGAWKQGGPGARAERPAPRAADGNRVLLVDKPGSLQTYFRFGQMGIDRSHPDYPARVLANTILGGRFTSRLNTALRIESGLTYGASSGFDDTLGGVFVVQSYTATATSAEALALAAKTYRSFVEGGITPEELESARAYVKGQYGPDNLETAGQQAAMILSLEFDGLPRDLVGRFFERLDAVTLAEANRVIRERFPLASLSWVVAGQAETLRPIVAGFGAVTEVSLAAPGFGPGFPAPAEG